MLEEGEGAPNFTLPGTQGGTIDQYSLTDHTTNGAVVLLFYPFDLSPVCTEELCNFRDSTWLTFTPNLALFGISTDTVYAHREFSQQIDLPFPLLSDHDGSVSEEYDVLYDELEHHPRVCKRAVFVINESQHVSYAWEGDPWTEDPNIHEIHAAMQGLNIIA